MTRQEQEVHLAGLARERENEERFLAILAERIEAARSRADESEVTRLERDQESHLEILKAVDEQLAFVSGEAKPRPRRATVR